MFRPIGADGRHEAVMRDGYVIAQEYLPKAVEGDTRVLMMNGRILRHKGEIAAIRRLRSKGICAATSPQAEPGLPPR